jgi:hypothetical protein
LQIPAHIAQIRIAEDDTLKLKPTGNILVILICGGVCG